jgi:hypothetical protein
VNSFHKVSRHFTEIPCGEFQLSAFGNFVCYIMQTSFTKRFGSHHTKCPGFYVTTIPVSKQCFMQTSMVGGDKTPRSQFLGPRRWSEKQRRFIILPTELPIFDWVMTAPVAQSQQKYVTTQTFRTKLVISEAEERLIPIRLELLYHRSVPITVGQYYLSNKIILRVLSAAQCISTCFTLKRRSSSGNKST